MEPKNRFTQADFDQHLEHMDMTLPPFHGDLPCIDLTTNNGKKRKSVAQSFHQLRSKQRGLVDYDSSDSSSCPSSSCSSDLEDHFRTPVRYIPPEKKKRAPKRISTDRQAANALFRAEKLTLRALQYLDAEADAMASKSLTMSPDTYKERLRTAQRNQVRGCLAGLDLNVWGHTGLVGGRITQYSDPPRMVNDYCNEAGFQGISKWTSKETREWIQSSDGDYLRTWLPHSPSRGDMVQYIIVAGDGRMNLHMLHLVMETFDLVAGWNQDDGIPRLLDQHTPDWVHGDDSWTRCLSYKMLLVAFAILYNMMPIETRPTKAYLVLCARILSAPVGDISHLEGILLDFMRDRSLRLISSGADPMYRDRTMTAEENRRKDATTHRYEGDTLAMLEECIEALSPICMTMRRQGTVYSIGVELLRLVILHDVDHSKELFDALCTVKLMRGHRDEMLWDASQRSAEHFCYTSKFLMALGLCLNVRMRLKPDSKWTSACQKCTGTTDMDLRPIAARMYEHTCIPPPTTNEVWYLTLSRTVLPYNEANWTFHVMKQTAEDMSRVPVELKRDLVEEEDLEQLGMYMARWNPDYCKEHPSYVYRVHVPRNSVDGKWFEDQLK